MKKGKRVLDAIIGVVASLAMAITLLVGMTPKVRADPPPTPSFVTIDFGGPSVARDVTRPDGIVKPALFGTDPRPGIGEIGQVNPNCETGKKWDLMGFGFQPNVTATTSTVWMVSGFDPRSTVNTEGHGFQTVFVDTDGNHLSPTPRSGDGHVNQLNSSYGFEYALNIISVSGNTMTYQVVGLGPDSILQRGEFGLNWASDPWALISSSADSVIFTKTTEVRTMNTADTLATTGVNTGYAYADQLIWGFEVPTSMFSWLDPQTPVTFFAGTGCSNDGMKGGILPINISAIPEPGSLLAVGCFLGSSLLIRTRRSMKMAA